MKKPLIMFAAACTAFAAIVAGELDKAILHGETDKERAIDYKPGEEMVFTLRLQNVETLPPNTYFIEWTRTGDDGVKEKGKVPASTTEPLVIKTKLDKPGFVRILAEVVNAKGAVYRKKFTGDTKTPEGKRAMNAFERTDKRIFFDGGAGVEPEKLQGVPEPADFDAFWARQRERLAKIPIAVDRKELPSKRGRVYAVQIDCAGIRPVTGYLTIPAGAAKGQKYPAALSTHGYAYHPPHNPPSWARDDLIALDINAHGMKLPAFGADEGYYKALGWEIRSNGQGYAFDTKQNEDAEVAYFNGMALRVMRALQYLKTLPEWNGKNLIASGGSQGGLQTIWAAGLDPDVTRANSSITWCCDMGGTELGRNRGNWYIHWTPALGYYDPINIAKRISPKCVTTITRAGLGDYTCPPSGLAILYNNIPGPKKINWVQGSTHGYVPKEPHQTFSLTANGWTE